MRQPHNRSAQLRLFLSFQRIRMRALEMSVKLFYCVQLCFIVIWAFVCWNIILLLQKKCLGCFTPHNFLFLLCNLTCTEGCSVDSNNIRHLKESPRFFVVVVVVLKRFSGGQEAGLWLCWMTNCIFFSENLCKVGSFVLTLILFVWHLCPILTRPFLYKWVFFF